MEYYEFYDTTKKETQFPNTQTKESAVWHVVYTTATRVDEML